MTKQSQRPFRLSVQDLGPDVLMCTAFTVQEGLSQLFWVQVECISEKPSQVKLSQLLGKAATIESQLADGSVRYFSGVVSRCAQTGRDVGSKVRFTHYRLEVVPWFWLLTRTTDSRIFQDKTIPAIIEKIFGDHGMKDFRNATKKQYTPLDYCVQYRETDFNFVSRLMEEEGIFYFFEHDNGKHTLVFADDSGVYKACPGKSDVQFAPEGGYGNREETVRSWQEQQELRPGLVTLWDHSFQMPPKNLESKTPTTINVGGNDKYEVYDYPGGYSHRFNKPDERMGNVEPEGRMLSRTRMEEEEAQHLVLSGTSDMRGFTAGMKFQLLSPPPGVTSGPYVLTLVEHSANQEAYVSNQGEISYSNRFTCIPAKVPYHPPRTTPRPVVQGTQTAVVVGPPGEEIYPDKYGRVKVQFHWDREGQRNEHSSCWIRCAQTAAGKGWGAMSIPRIGQEVVVSYLEGDPDQPLITGMVYNADQMPPYKLPDEKTKSYLKTNSSMGGVGYNEIRFEDLKDKEQIFIHAQKDLDRRVLNDARESVLHNRHETVNGSHTEHVGGNMQLLVGGGEGGGNQDIVIKADKKELIEANNHLHVKGDRKEKVDGDQSLTVGASQQEKVNKLYALEAGQEIHLKGGMKVIIEAGMQLTIKGPGGFVDIGPAGVTIQGVLVNINSGGSAGTGSGCSPAAPTDAQEAKPAAAADSTTGQKSAP